MLCTPEFLLNAILLPVNFKRLLEIIRLTKQIEQATVESPVLDWLLPHMHLRKHNAGDALFRKGDKSHEVVYVAAGRLKLQEVDHYIEPGELIGEIGLFSAEKVRTMTVVCETNCELYTMTDEMIYHLYYQNPKLGFFFMQLIVERLLRDIRRGNPQYASFRIVVDGTQVLGPMTVKHIRGRHGILLNLDSTPLQPETLQPYR
ncbi:MAG TPA: cyclic nucleotide-binding domain-containing protein [Nitrospira sp.]|nr:cyclic nucleotide-binding domain-containing protein [Nitrospira sp.]